MPAVPTNPRVPPPGDAPPTIAPATWDIVQTKAFGDLVIAASTLRKLPDRLRERFGLLIGPHLRELADALDPRCGVRVLPITGDLARALFDPRVGNPIVKLRSALALRRAFRDTAIGSTLVLWRLGPKQRFIAGRNPAVALPDADNVYLAYDAFFRGIFGEFAESVAPSACRPVPASARIAICPFSRHSRKNLPADLVISLFETCARVGRRAELLLLDGESFEPRDVIPTTVVPRRFAALGEALASFSAVISADSLPAHLAEYRGTPAFVVSPRPNAYWLPPRAFADESWGVFDERAELTGRLERLLGDVAG